MGKETLSPGVIVGRSMLFWTHALRLAGALVAAEQFLPAVKGEEGKAIACWQPILAGGWAKRLRELAARMPAACRAMSSETRVEPNSSAADILTDFLNRAVDALVRTSLTPAVAQPESAHDRWLNALTSKSARLSAADAGGLIREARDWARPIAVADAAPFRLCFRLEEPAANGNGTVADASIAFVEESQPWHLRYLLQASDDPSLLVPAVDAFATNGAANGILRRNGFNAREYALTALGRAATAWPMLENSLRSARPNGCDLDQTHAFHFLTERAWLLEQAGFGVLLPAWWARKGTKNRLTIGAHVRSPKMQSGGGLSLDSLVAFDWVAAVGDQTLTAQELNALAKLKTPLVKIRGQWVHVNAEEINAALSFWKKKGKVPLREIVRMSLGGGEAAGSLPFAGVTAEGWVGDFLTQLDQRIGFEELPPPEGFTGTLRPYQVRGYSWLEFLRRWGLGACLADDMGLGKTVQTLAAIQHGWHQGPKRPTLLVCPMSVVGNWQREAERFTADLPVLVHHGLERVKGAAFKKEAAKHALVLTSYALLHRDAELLNAVEWGGIILDEAQNIKNPETRQAKSARGLKSGWRVALTGTPVENHVGDLWSVMEFLNPGFLGTQSSFRQNFFVPIQAGRDPEAAKRLQRLTGPFVLRRLKTDKTIISDLPDKLEMKVYCTLTKEQASLYAATIDEEMGGIESSGSGIERKGRILALLTKLKQVCNHPAHLLGDNSPLPGRSGKLSRLTEMLEEALETGDRALIFTQFTEMGTLIKKHLEETFGREVSFLHGAVTKKRRDAMVAGFQAATDDSPRVFILSLKAGGTGLNLTAANHVFHFDRWWNPAVENQATDRAFRIGQTRNVQVHKFICAGTLEDRIDALIEGKKEVAARVVGSGEGWLTEMSNAQLKDLFALRAEALE